LAQLLVTGRDANFVKRQAKGIQDPLLGISDGAVEIKDHVLGQRTHSTIMTRFLASSFA
jgi:hypothetical protein